MIREDARGRRVAIVPDWLVNPGSALYEPLPGSPGRVLDALVEDGWGLMTPPPHVVGAGIGRPAVEVIAGDAVDYRRHGYAVVVLAVDGLPGGGVWLDLLEAAFQRLDEPMPPVVPVPLHGAGDDASAGSRAIHEALAAACAGTGRPR